MPAPRQSLRRRDGGRTKGNPLVLTSCRPPCGDGCVRPPVPKAKLWLEQAGSEHRASARGTGGDSGVWKGASKGGNAPITGPFPPPGGHKGNVMERRGENGKMQVGPTTNSTTRLPVRPASSCSNKSFAFGTLGLVGTGSHGGARQNPRHTDTLPAVRPGPGRDFSQVVPALRQSLRRRAGVCTKGSTLS